MLHGIHIFFKRLGGITVTQSFAKKRKVSQRNKIRNGGSNWLIIDIMNFIAISRVVNKRCIKCEI